MIVIGNQKQREIIAILLGLFAIVGLCRKAGIYIPLVSQGVISIIQAALLLVSGWVEVPSVFLVYVKTFLNHLAWCVSATWLGVAAWLWSSRDHAAEGFLEIICYYGIFMTLLVSSAVFTFSYNFDPFFHIRFYASSFPLSLALSLLAGKFWSIVQQFPRKSR